MTTRGHLVVYLCLAIIEVLQGADLDCDFEIDFCQWTNGSFVRKWQRHSTDTIIPGTGPNTGHTISGRNDYYIYLHAAERKDQNGFVESGNCVLVSPVFNTTSGGGCFRFWYHMKGSGIGNLSATVFEGSSSDEIWSKAGEQGPDWKCAHVSLEQGREGLTIEMTAWTGLNLLGDIALDDFKFFDSECSGISDVCGNATTPSISPPPSQSPTPDKPSSTSTTAASVSTTPAEDDITMTIVYISIAPIILLVVAAIVAVVVYRSRSKAQDHENNNSIVRNHHNNQTDPDADEYDYIRDDVYDVLDESKMYSTGHVFPNSTNDNQTQPVPSVTINHDQPTSDQRGHPDVPTVLYRAAGSSGRAEIGNDATGSYVSMKTKDVSEGGNYIMSVPGPNEIGESGDVANVSGKEGGASEASHGDAVGTEGGLILPPHPCGTTSSYITPVFEND